jgi:hypothetical protein
MSLVKDKLWEYCLNIAHKCFQLTKHIEEGFFSFRVTMVDWNLEKNLANLLLDETKFIKPFFRVIAVLGIELKANGTLQPGPHTYPSDRVSCLLTWLVPDYNPPTSAF